MPGKKVQVFDLDQVTWAFMTRSKQLDGARVALYLVHVFPEPGKVARAVFGLFNASG